jgi:hypothetical protein
MFRHSERSEESLRLLAMNPRGIPHFAWNDGVVVFFCNLFRRAMSAGFPCETPQSKLIAVSFAAL